MPRKNIAISSQKSRHDYSNNFISYAIINNDHLFEEVKLLCAAANMTISRVNSFTIWDHWSRKYPLIIDQDTAIAVGNHLSPRSDLWIVSHTHSLIVNYQSDLPNATSIVLPDDAELFLNAYICTHTSKSLAHSYKHNNHTNDTYINTRAIQSILARPVGQNDYCRKDITDYRSNSDIAPSQHLHKTTTKPSNKYSSLISVLGVHGGAGTTTLAVLLAKHISVTRQILFFDIDKHSPIRLGMKIDNNLIGNTIIPHNRRLNFEQIIQSSPTVSAGFRYLSLSAMGLDEHSGQAADLLSSSVSQSITTICDLGGIRDYRDICSYTYNSDAVIVVTRGHRLAALQLYEHMHAIRHNTIVIVVIGPFLYGMTRSLFEKIAQIKIHMHLPLDTAIAVSGISDKLDPNRKYTQYLTELQKRIAL